MAKIKVKYLAWVAGMIIRCLFVLGVNCFDFLGYGNRYRMQQLQQEDWIKQQLREKQLYKENAKNAAQT